MSDGKRHFSKIPSPELRDTLELGKGTLRKWVQRGKISPKYFALDSRTEHAGKVLVIDPRGLPEKHRQTWVMKQIEAGDLPAPPEQEATGYEWETAAEWRKEEAEKRYRFLQAVPDDLTTAAKKKAIKKYKATTPTEEQPAGVSMASWYRYRNAHDERGLAGLMPDPRPSGDTKITDTDYNRFKKLYLTRDRRSARQCWRRVWGAAREEGRGEDFPVAQTFLNLIKQREGQDVIDITRRGLEWYNQRKSPHIDRDWSVIPAGDVWFSDHRLFDMLVVDEETGEIGRPWFTPWMDARSTFFLSWDVYLDHPNSDRIHLTFKRAVEAHGRPTTAYVDNGKDYRALDFAGGPKRNQKTAPDVDETRTASVLDLMGVDPVFARPYNARAKTIERKFQYFIEQMEKFSTSYTGGAPHERPELTEKRRKAAKKNPEAAAELGTLPTLQAFRQRVAEWVDRINRMPSDGQILGGHSPKEIFHAERGPERRIDPKHLGILCLRSSSTRQINRCQWKDSELGITYTAEWMYEPRVSGRKAYARRDPQSPETAWIHDAENGKLLGVAKKKKKVPAIVDPETNPEGAEEMRRQMKMNDEYVRHLKAKKREIEKNQPTAEEMDRWAESYIRHHEEKRREEGTYLEEGGPRPVKHEESEDVARWIEQAEADRATGRDDLPYEPAPIEEEDDDIKLWPDE